MSSDVSSGHASLTQIIIEEFCKDEAPKAPVLLYASEGRNPFQNCEISDTNMQYKRDLFELNQSFWLGSLAQHATMVIPFNDKVVEDVKSDLLGNY